MSHEKESAATSQKPERAHDSDYSGGDPHSGDGGAENSPEGKGRKATRSLIRYGMGAGLAGLFIAVIFFTLPLAEREDIHARTCSAKFPDRSKIDSVIQGEIAAFRLADKPQNWGDLQFTDAAGKIVKLSSLSEQVTLVNLWASWCAPCKEEMPSLNNLAHYFDGQGFRIIPISMDIDDGTKAKKFLEEIKADKLPLYLDQKMSVFGVLRQAGRVAGLPASLIIDADGCEIGVLNGPADWASLDAQKLILALLPD